MMKISFRKILPRGLAVLAFAGPALACSIFLGGPTPPGPAITPVGEVNAIEGAWSQAVDLSGDGTVIVIFNEAQMTAFLQGKLQENPDNSLQSAQVYLRDGRIQIYGMLVTGSATASLLISLRPEVTEAGGIDFVVEQAQVGPLTLPSGLLSAVSKILTEAFTGQVGSLATGFQVQEVLVGDGQIAIRGIVR